MQTMKKLKIILGISYIVFLGIFLYLLITKNWYKGAYIL